MNKENKLNFFKIAFLYIGTMLGAGMASGRELWQFFGVFGKKGMFGIFILGIMYVLIAVMASILAKLKRTSDMGRIISPVDTKKVVAAIGYIIASLLLVALITMSAAMGSLFEQEFGINKIIGNMLLVFLVTITVLGGFGKVQKMIDILTPIVMLFVIVIAITILTGDIPKDAIQQAPEKSMWTPTWLISAFLYSLFCGISVIPINATAATKAENFKTAIIGSMLGGIGLFVLSFLIYKALMVDPGYAQAMDLPMLALVKKRSLGLGVAFIFIMSFAIYSSAAGNFYGFTTKLRDDENKNKKIILFAFLAFVLSLFGFKNIVSYIFPLIGVVGLLAFVLLSINFFRLFVVNFVTTQERNKFKFPKGAINMTTGRGGASILFIGSQKTALADCGNAYCGEELVAKLKKELKERPLDYLLLSHTHYDHVGALPSLRKEWPDLKVVSNAHGKGVFERPGALKAIKARGEDALKLFGDANSTPVTTEGMWVDIVVADGDVIDLGDKKVNVLETPGHTRDSITYCIEPLGIMLASESVGILERKGMCHPAILQSYEDAIASIEKCRNYKPKRVIISHYGIVPASYNEKMWDMLQREAKAERAVITEAWRDGKTEEEILDMMIDRYFYEGRRMEQPIEAFKINMICTIRLYKSRALDN